MAFRLNQRLPRAWWKTAAMAVTAVAVFVFAWLFKFNDPGGSFAGLTDDHFFYLIRGWQILLGDLPVRDFVDHGAPLYYYVAAAVQALFGRGTVSELAFSSAMLALGASLTCWLASRASGSILLGVAAAAFQLLLDPRFYNYPKILVYAVAIPLIWRFADKPERKATFWIALVTVIGFLFRHDHGVFVAAAFAVLLLCLGDVPWRQRAGYALAYVVLVCVLVSPYLLFVQQHGGVVSYMQQAAAWAERDRDRAPVEWPGLFDDPEGRSEEAENGGAVARTVATVRDNRVAWLFYLEIALPFFALAVLAVSRDAFRPSWPHALPKLVSVAALGIILDAGFLRSPLEARLADPSVPLAILLAWLVVAVPRLVVNRNSWRDAMRRVLVPARAAFAVGGLVLAGLFGVILGDDVYERLDKSALVERWGKPFERAGYIRGALTEEWELATWAARDERPDLINLALYLHACTTEQDRIFVQPYIPQVLALARRGFAGGHADLRPGFFKTEEAQQLTLRRLQAQSVPVVLLETGDSLDNFRSSFPLIAAYLDERYAVAGTHTFDQRFGITVLAARNVTPARRYQPFDWPCFAGGSI
jgi:hypothetical protein